MTLFVIHEKSTENIQIYIYIYWNNENKCKVKRSFTNFQENNRSLVCSSSFANQFGCQSAPSNAVNQGIEKFFQALTLFWHPLHTVDQCRNLVNKFWTFPILTGWRQSWQHLKNGLFGKLCLPVVKSLSWVVSNLHCSASTVQHHGPLEKSAFYNDIFLY